MAMTAAACPVLRHDPVVAFLVSGHGWQAKGVNFLTLAAELFSLWDRHPH
jgi:hypothetical protein